MPSFLNFLPFHPSLASVDELQPFSFFPSQGVKPPDSSSDHIPCSKPTLNHFDFFPSARQFTIFLFSTLFSQPLT